MKKLTLILIGLLAVSSLAACNNTNNNSSSTPVVESSMEDLIDEPEDITPPEMDGGPIEGPAGASLYRGIVEGVEEAGEGITHLVLRQAEGTNFGHETLRVALEEDTQLGVDRETLANGHYVEVYYGAPMGGELEQPVKAIVVNKLADADLSVTNGTLKEHTPDEEQEGAGTLLLDKGEGDEILFHYTPETQFYLDFDAMTQGDELSIYSNGTTTRSIPPQGNALEVRPLYRAEAEDSVTAEPQTDSELNPEPELVPETDLQDEPQA